MDKTEMRKLQEFLRQSFVNDAIRVTQARKDPENADVRLLLYRCYRAVIAIVTEYYRPHSDSSRKEREGRRKLTSILADLEKIDMEVGDALKRVRSISSDGERSKRQKVEENQF